VLNPFLSEDDLLRLILQDFGVVSREEFKRGRLAGVSKQELIDTLNEFLLSLLPLHASALLIIDEAQNLPYQVLEQIRILSNLETDKEKLLQIVMVGQLNLRDVLRSPELRQLDQRVSIRYELKPLTPEETSAYIAHRLTIAGGGAVVSFAPKAVEFVHRYTSGIPRLINLVCDRALLGGFSARTNRITPEMVIAAAGGLDLAIQRRSVLRWVKRRAASFAAGAAMMAALSSLAAYGVIGLQARAVSPRHGEVVDRVKSAQPAAQPVPAVQHNVQPQPQAALVVAKQASAPEFIVLVGSFRIQTQADMLRDQLRALGYRTYANQAASPNRGLWHQVFVGPYDQLDQARQDEARVRKMPGYADAHLVTP
jgi:general secretion pathway protein A